MQISPDNVYRFLEQISWAALANPFGQDRDDLDKKIIKEWLNEEDKKQPEIDRIANFTSEVLKRILSNQNEYRPTDVKKKNILNDAVLFALFHKYTNAFDQHIQRQNEAPGVNLELSFSEKIERDFVQHGLEEQFEHLIALFFQMRRAFFFISHFVGGGSEPVKKLRERLWRTLFSVDLRNYIKTLYSKMESFSVLLLGETGVGKGQAAAALGRSAYIPYDRKSQKFSASFLDIFVSANICEYPETLVESELFGHKKGSFTGALEHHAGLFAQTHRHGVLFLDEIGELEIPVQVKILRVLQERFFSPVGSHEKKRFSGRLIAATNANINQKVAAGKFRSDLYHRLASDVITIPSLRDRFFADSFEMPLLVARVVERLFGEKDQCRTDFVCGVLRNAVPTNYRWPGNLREFEQVVRRILLHGETIESVVTEQQNANETLGKDDLGLFAPRSGQFHWTADEIMSYYARHAYNELGSYESVAQKLNVDWRTAKRWILLSPPQKVR